MRPIVNMPEEDRATDIGNMYKKNWQRSRVWFRTYPRGQTDRQTDSSQYFATAPVGKVTTDCKHSDIYNNDNPAVFVLNTLAYFPANQSKHSVKF